jgi:hypothetical protein
MCVDGENGLIQLTAQRPVYTPLIHRTDVGRAVKVTRIQATRSVCTSTMVDQWTHHSIKLNPWLGSFIQLITMITINTFTHSVSSSSSMDFCSRQRGSHVTQDWFDHFDDDRTALEMFLYILLPCQILVMCRCMAMENITEMTGNTIIVGHWCPLQKMTITPSMKTIVRSSPATWWRDVVVYDTATDIADMWGCVFLFLFLRINDRLSSIMSIIQMKTV